MTTSTSTSHAVRAIARSALAAAVVVAIAAGCGSSVRVARHTTPTLEGERGLVALGLIAGTSQRARVHIDGDKSFTLAEVNGGSHFFVLELPAGMYCTAVIEWTELSQSEADVRPLRPCIEVQPGVLRYAGHYALGFARDLPAQSSRSEALRQLEADYPELLSRYPLQ